MREPQGVASLALGYVLHWAFSPPLLNPKLELHKQSQFATLPTNIKRRLITKSICGESSLC